MMRLGRAGLIDPCTIEMARPNVARRDGSSCSGRFFRPRGVRFGSAAGGRAGGLRSVGSRSGPILLGFVKARLGGASKFSCSRDAIWRHMRDHVSPEAKAHLLVGARTLDELACSVTIGRVYATHRNNHSRLALVHTNSSLRAE
jgi:hypothetical protein